MHILSSKLRRPVPPPGIVDRPRIFARLDQWQTTPVIFVHAPAGYGKTILASRWIEVRGLTSQAAWLSLDPGDDDPLQFLRYLAAGLEPLAPGIAAAVEPLLEDPEAQPVRVIGIAMGHCDPANSLSDLFFNTRLKALINAGEIQANGSQSSIRYYSVSRTTKASRSGALKNAG